MRSVAIQYNRKRDTSKEGGHVTTRLFNYLHVSINLFCSV